MSKRSSIFFFTIIICADIHFANTRSSNKISKKCTYDQRIDVAIEFKESRTRGAKLLDAVTKDDLNTCQESCCQFHGCTVALFHSTNTSENCYLIRCHTPETCTYTALDSFSTSIVTNEGETDTDVQEEDYVTIPWPEWLIDRENETISTPPNSKTTSSHLNSVTPSSHPEEIFSTLKSSTLTPANVLTNEEVTTPEIIDSNKITTQLNLTSSSATPDKPVMPLVTEQTFSSSSTVSLSENSSLSNPAESSATPTVNLLPSSSLPLNTTGGSSSSPSGETSSTPLVTASISSENSSTALVAASKSGESTYVNVTDKSIEETTKPTLENVEQTDAASINTTSIPPQITTTDISTTTNLPTQPATSQPTTTMKEVTEESPSTTTQTRFVDVTDLVSDTGVTTNLHKPVNESTSSVIRNEVSYNKLSSNGALIASLCFGVLFACAVCVLLGKGWYEGYQRRHYSKVDYLINGMYN